MEYIKIEDVLDLYGLKIVENPEWLWVVMGSGDGSLIRFERGAPQVRRVV